MGLNPGEFIQGINGRRVGQLDGAAALDALVEEIASRPNGKIELEVMRGNYPENGNQGGVAPRRIKGELDR